jgi:UDP-N-acetylglucosamine:LPS N-acetylglucosamine transferase
MIAAGGTGGHVYPALAVVEALYDENPQHELVFVGTRGGGGFEKRLVDESGLHFSAYEEVFAGPVVGINPLRAFLNLTKMAWGMRQALDLLSRHQPQAILLTGGWANIPIAFAARIKNVPTLVYLPDIEPGRTIQLVANFAQRIAITVDASEEYFTGKSTVVTGYPLRRALREASADDAYSVLNLSKTHKTLLVMGGSRGARSINLAIEAILPALLDDGVQILHITGTLDWERNQKTVTRMLENHSNAHRYHVIPYSNDIGNLMAVADLTVARAGASSLGELPFFALPAILVPYPYAWRYQRINADYLAERGAAVRLDDEKMPDELLPTIRRILQDETQYATMQASVRRLAISDGAGNIARELLGLGVK